MLFALVTDVEIEIINVVLGEPKTYNDSLCTGTSFRVENLTQF